MKKKYKRKIVRNYHHIINKCLGGDSSTSNLLLIKVVRHNALHKMFGSQSLRQMYCTIDNMNYRLTIMCDHCLDAWLDLFGDKTKTEALALIERVIRAKENQRRLSSNYDDFLSQD